MAGSSRAAGASVVVAAAVLCSLQAGAAGQSRAAAPPDDAPVYRYKVVRSFPHDARAFTQGLIVKDGVLFESTGLNGRSSLRKVALETGAVLQKHDVEEKYFAEGLTEWNGRLLQLTWQHHVGFVYTLSSFAFERTFAYSGEGWGLTHDRARLILSDGTAYLRFLNPDTFQETGHVLVKDRGREITQLNELEFVKGEVYANIWQTDRIARINPDTGKVVGWIDLAGLLPKAERLDPGAVLNGIAYEAARDRLFVTGKLWPKVFEITLTK